jgi:hypothetical protein
MAKKPKKSVEIPELVSARFLALAGGVAYGVMMARLLRYGVRIGHDRLRYWADAQKGFADKLISGEALRLLAEHAKPQIGTTTPVEVPGDVFKVIRAAWTAIGAPGSPLLTTKDDVDGIPEDFSTSAKLDIVRLETQQENLRYKQLVSRRLQSMMCDRMQVESECKRAVLIIQRFLRNIPARMTGELVKTSALSDSELRILEKVLQDEVMITLREVRAAFDAVPAEAAAVAATRRYSDRNWSVQAGSA